MSVRPGRNPDLGEFEVIQVTLEDGEQKELASGLASHALNTPPDLTKVDASLDVHQVLMIYEDDLIMNLEAELEKNPDFVRIAGRWFPRTLLVDINAGHLNLAEAVLDMVGGGPLPTSALIEQIGLSTAVNPKLVEFSLDLALQEDAARRGRPGRRGAMVLTATYTEIGQYFGRRNHSTAVAAEKKVREWLKENRNLHLGQRTMRVGDALKVSNGSCFARM